MSAFPLHPERRGVVITGASSGIGAATAMVLGAAGFPIVLGARRTERLDDIVAAVRAGGGEATAQALDVTDDASVRAFVDAARSALGTIEVVVSNAGGMTPQPIATTPPSSFAAQLDVNLVGAQRLCHAVLPAMIERRRGDIVLVTSQNAKAPRPLLAAYNASKAGLETFGRTLQMELEGSGVRASIVRPGPTLTEMGWDWEPDALNQLFASWKRWGLLRNDHYLPAESIASAVLVAVSAPRGTNLSLIEVEPEAPIRPVAADAEEPTP